jgi:hypothetical protein
MLHMTTVSGLCVQCIFSRECGHSEKANDCHEDIQKNANDRNLVVRSKKYCNCVSRFSQVPIADANNLLQGTNRPLTLLP